MASRKEQKEQARNRRLAEERALRERAQRRLRVRMLGGVGLIAAAFVAVAIAVSTGASGSSPKPQSAAAKRSAATVDALLKGIPQSGSTLGSPKAKVTLTEFGDLKCPICRQFALGAEEQLIARDVRAGRLKIDYRALCTATCAGPQPGVFSTQQAAALAAGEQNRAWNYIELFYHLQGDETTSYVTPSFLENLAKLVPGLNYGKWMSDRGSSALAGRVSADRRAAQAAGFSGTPSVIVKGPKGVRTIAYLGDYATYEAAIKAVQ
jgi:protein-disulfide isomerase